MIYMNSKMTDYLNVNKSKIENTRLDIGLEKILERGFLVIGECVFVKEIYPFNYSLDSLNIKDIEPEFLDYSGYEYATNKFHIEDFTNKNPFIQSIVFGKKLKEKLLDSFSSDEFVIVITFQNDEVGKFAHFSFHKKREGEMIYDANSINNEALKDSPIYLEIVTPNPIRHNYQN